MTTRRQASLFPELAEKIGMPKPVNIASVPQRSPFRYPGGKTWFVPAFRHWVATTYPKPTLLVEPFAEGGIISLTALFEKMVQKAVMVELDDEIAAVWKSIVNSDIEWLANRIITFDFFKEAVIKEIRKISKTQREQE